MHESSGRHGPVVVHCVTGTREELFDYLDRDWHVGITGWLCDERSGQHPRELVPNIPANRLMVETDAPYLLTGTLSPKPRERHNEQAFLAHLQHKLQTHPSACHASNQPTAPAAKRPLRRIPSHTPPPPP